MEVRTQIGPNDSINSVRLTPFADHPHKRRVNLTTGGSIGDVQETNLLRGRAFSLAQIGNRIVQIDSRALNVPRYDRRAIHGVYDERQTAVHRDA